MTTDEIRNMLIYYEMLVVDQRNRIINLRMQIEGANEEAANQAAREFSKENEELYLKLKALIHEIRGEKSNNLIEEIGTTDSFPSYFKEHDKGVWQLHLPPFYSVSAKKKLYNEGKHIYYLVMNLLSEYERSGKKIKKLKNPLIIFRHHICTKTQKVFDYDNIDSKRAIDAMQGYFLNDDNALYLTVVHEAVEDEKDSFCDIFIIEQKTKNSFYSKKISNLF